MKVGDIRHGFEVKRVREVSELEGTMYEMEHIKSGAKLIWMKNEEENKLFSIAFRTPPTDDTGVFHILEHSVLNGSRKYRAKEPFVELLKSSMKTFLNAMTFPDKTLFPVSSRNQADFINLTRVYLDAVFYPAIYENPNIFYQEGWHYELRDEKEEPAYKGVVFNEMKGALSSIDHRIQTEMKKILFSENAYSFESGGIPEYITDLTYEQFLETHRTYYKPSNARIYLDGNMEIDKILAIIGEEYLNDFECEKEMPFIPLQTRKKTEEKESDYEIPETEEEGKRTHLVKGRIIGTWEDRKRVLAMQMLAEYLTASNDAPLKRGIVASGLVQDMSMMVYDGIQQPFYVLHMSGMNYEDKASVEKLLADECKRIAEEGFEKEELEAVINQYEFRMKEGSEPKGLFRNMMALNAWAFGGDPLLYMTYQETFAELKKGLGENYFEEVFQNAFLGEEGMASLLLKPSKTLGTEKRDAEKAKLKAKKDAWTKAEIEKILQQNKQLEEWQMTPDTEENLQTLPKLSLQEIGSEPVKKVTLESETDGVRILRHPTKENGIIYLKAYFNLGEVSDEEMASIGLLSDLLGELPTEHYTVAELQQEMRKQVGMLLFDVEEYGRAEEKEKSRLMLTARCKVLKEKVEEAEKLIEEILLHTNWEEYEKTAELLLQSYQLFQQAIVTQGHSYAMTRIGAKFSAEGYAKECMEGYTCYAHLNEIVQDLQRGAREYAEKM